MKTTRREHAEARRLQLIDTALDVFAAKGLEAATVKDLSDAAGVAQGLLYHYFPSKEALLEAVLERHYFLPEIRRILSADRHRPAAEVLLEVARGFARVMDENRSVMQLMLREAPSNPLIAERIERSRREGVRLLSEYLQSRVAMGELRPHDSETAARLLMYGVVAAHLAGTPPEPFVPAAVDILLQGLLA
ncbi:MAG TPA: TetR/AcrR family transcriptional regulator [Chloroflexota bacterium]|nr:TetR/AcrR family transcriptional regulator [Chloroflexota bacterium]